MLVSTTCLAAMLMVAPGSGWVAPAASTWVQLSAVSDQRSSAGSVSVTVTVLPLTSDRVSDPPPLSEKVPFDQVEPASADDEV